MGSEGAAGWFTNSSPSAVPWIRMFPSPQDFLLLGRTSGRWIRRRPQQHYKKFANARRVWGASENEDLNFFLALRPMAWLWAFWLWLYCNRDQTVFVSARRSAVRSYRILLLSTFTLSGPSEQSHPSHLLILLVFWPLLLVHDDHVHTDEPRATTPLFRTLFTLSLHRKSRKRQWLHSGVT